MLEASKVTVGDKTYELNYVGKKKKGNLRRKIIIELIQSKPAGELIKMAEFQEAGRFTTRANTHAFVKLMIRDGVISQYDGDKPKSHYYAVTGAVRVVKPKDGGGTMATSPNDTPDLNGFVESMQKLGVKFTITITNESAK